MIIIHEKKKVLEEYQNTFMQEWKSSNFDCSNEFVWGEGNLAAAIMMVGEAPGKKEVEQRHPFVGKAGENLNTFLQMVNIKREDIYITNAVKIRPTKISPKGTLSNRPPNRQELTICRKLLFQEVMLVKPRIIVTLGNIPLKSLHCNKNLTIGEVHGRMLHLDLDGNGFNLFPLYHPASIIYNRSLEPEYKNDMSILSTLIKSEII